MEDSLEKIDSSNKKRGIKKTVGLQIQRNWVVILLAIINLLATTSSTIYTNNQILEIKNENNNLVNTQVGFFQNPTDPKLQLAPDEQQVHAAATSIEFNKKDWIHENFFFDEEGFLCRDNTKNTFPFWSIWTIKKYPIEFGTLTVRFRIKSRRDQKNPPTIAVSYGEYQANIKSIETIYRLNIFDTNITDIRLYNKNNDSEGNQAYFGEPDLTQEIVITLSPKIANERAKKVSINPTLDYLPTNTNSTVPWIPSDGFETSLFIPQPSSIQKQIGIGVLKDTCFKIASFEVI